MSDDDYNKINSKLDSVLEKVQKVSEETIRLEGRMNTFGDHITTIEETLKEMTTDVTFLKESNIIQKNVISSFEVSANRRHQNRVYLGIVAISSSITYAVNYVLNKVLG